MRHTGPRNRLARRQGADLELKTFGSKNHSRLMRLIGVPPGQHGVVKRRKVSESSKQLREKQKLKFMFGVTERQMSNYFTKAKRAKGNTAKMLCQLLETRLDNVIYRSGFTPTRAAARQLVSHGHIALNGKKLSIASHQLSVGDTITFINSESAKIPHIDMAITRADFVAPSWLQRDGLSAVMKIIPGSEYLEKQLNLRLIIEFYSK